MSVYVEFLENIPTVLKIFIFQTILCESLVLYLNDRILLWKYFQMLQTSKQHKKFYSLIIVVAGIRLSLCRCWDCFTF